MISSQLTAHFSSCCHNNIGGTIVAVSSLARSKITCSCFILIKNMSIFFRLRRQQQVGTHVFTHKTTLRLLQSPFRSFSLEQSLTDLGFGLQPTTANPRCWWRASWLLQDLSAHSAALAHQQCLPGVFDSRVDVRQRGRWMPGGGVARGGAGKKLHALGGAMNRFHNRSEEKPRGARGS